VAPCTLVIIGVWRPYRSMSLARSGLTLARGRGPCGRAIGGDDWLTAGHRAMLRWPPVLGTRPKRERGEPAWDARKLAGTPAENSAQERQRYAASRSVRDGPAIPPADPRSSSPVESSTLNWPHPLSASSCTASASAQLSQRAGDRG